MKKALLVTLMLSLVQVSTASVNTISNNVLTYSRANISSSYGSSKNIYDTNSGGVHRSNNTEITRAINVLKKKSGDSDSLNRRLYDERKQSHAVYLEMDGSSGYQEVNEKIAEPEETDPHTLYLESLSEMKKWANQGNIEYQVKLGKIYLEGQNVRQDLVLSRRMFQKAAAKGNSEAQIYFGFFNEEGVGGLRRNKAIAKEWYGKACDSGNTHGCASYRRLNE